MTWQVAYRRQEGSHDGKVVIYLEGGGACWDTVTCGQRCDAGSEEAELCTADHDEVAGVIHLNLHCMIPGGCRGGAGAGPGTRRTPGLTTGPCTCGTAAATSGPAPAAPGPRPAASTSTAATSSRRS